MAHSATRKSNTRIRHPLTLLFALVVLLVNLFVIGLAYQMMQQSREQYENLAAVASQNMASLLEQSTADSIERVELGLFAVGDEIARQMAAGGIDRKRLNEYINRLYSRFPELEGLRVTNAEGIVSYGVNVPENSDVSIAADEHFPYLRDHPGGRTVISEPKFGKISKKWTIKVVRRYDYPDGSFAGLISGIIELEHFAKHFAALNVGANGTIALRDDELKLIVRHPEYGKMSDAIGQKNSSSTFDNALRTQPIKGTFSATSPIDGVERTLSYQKVGKWPLYVHVALAKDDFLAEWRQRVRTTAIAASIFVIISILLSWLNYRYWLTRRTLEKAMQHMAQYDSLTNLPNRALFYDRLHQGIHLAKRERHELALLYLDLDKFKPVNDTLGHHAGDQLLTQVGARIQGLLRESDTVARLGGDEFGVLLPKAGSRDDVSRVAGKIIDALLQPFALEGVNQEVRISASVGIAFFPADADNGEDMVRAADAAMYQAKQDGSTFRFFDARQAP